MNLDHVKHALVTVVEHSICTLWTGYQHGKKKGARHVLILLPQATESIGGYSTESVLHGLCDSNGYLSGCRAQTLAGTYLIDSNQNQISNQIVYFVWQQYDGLTQK